MARQLVNEAGAVLDDVSHNALISHISLLVVIREEEGEEELVV
jgi:hypothetical protein